MPLSIQRGSPPHQALRVVGIAIVAWFALSPLFRTLKPNEFGELVDICILAIAALSLNLLIGFTGQISIGHSAFFGLGAYTTAVLVKDHGWSPGWTFFAAAILCFVVGVFVGVPALRLKGLYLALVTLALAQIFPQLVRKLDFVTGGSKGISGVTYTPPSWTGLSSNNRADRNEWLYWIGLVLVILCFVVVRNLVKSRIGRAMVAMRDNELAASVMGVHLAVVKTVVFGISAAMCGLGGSLFAIRQTQATPDIPYFTIIGSIIFLVVMVLGGAASLTGPIVGAIVYYRLDEYTRGIEGKDYIPNTVRDFLQGRPNLATLIFAAVLIGLMFVAPDGVVGLAKRLSRRVVRIVKPRPTPEAPEVLATTAPAAATLFQRPSEAVPETGGAIE
jgi:branched-chain amino acid transport system permease protein